MSLAHSFVNKEPASAACEDGLCQQLTAFCKASADQLRLQILRVLSEESFGVLELCSLFATKQSGMSHHLKVLAEAGLVDRRREGNSLFYRRSHTACHPALESLQASLFETVNQLVLPAAVRAQIKNIHRDRAQTSLEFFAQNAEKFREQQDLIVSYAAYGDNVRSLLDSVPLHAYGNALEVGPGEGEFLLELAPRFQQVIALDNSKTMLARARRLVTEGRYDNIRLIHGDTTTLASKAIDDVDCAVINMVLHHTPSPAEMVQDVARVLNPGGILLVTDLCRHDQNWVRDACGDLWLGFEPEDLKRWATSAGLVIGRDLYLALRNGFQIQIRHFYKPVLMPEAGQHAI